MLTMVAAGGAFALLSYRNSARDARNNQPGNLYVRTERSGEYWRSNLRGAESEC